MTLNFNNLKNFVCDYLIRTEPNLVWSRDNSYTNITKTINSDKEEIIFNNKIDDEKTYNAILGLGSFDISITKNGLSTKLAEGEYEVSNDEVKKTIHDLHEYITTNTVEESIFNPETLEEEMFPVYAYGDFCTEYLVYLNNKGDEYDSIPLYQYDGERKSLGNKYYNPIILNYFKKLINFFAEKHRIFLDISTEMQKNYIYIYKFTSPYTQKIKSSSSVGMQTTSAHMDQCNLDNDNLIAEKYCEISSIVYTRVKNDCSEPKDYYASAAFFYGPEIPMPIQGEVDLNFENKKLNIPMLHDSLLYNFQHNYKRLFVSAPMKTSGWAIWMNKPKRTIRNTNPEDPLQLTTSNFKPWKKSTNYTHYAQPDNEFVYHASPFIAPGTKNWAPTSNQGCNIQRANITVRRTNHNPFRMIRDLFDSNAKIKLNAQGMIQTLIRMTKVYKKDILKNIILDGKTYDMSNETMKNICEYLKQLFKSKNDAYHMIISQIYKKFKNNKILVICDPKKCEDFSKFSELERYNISNGLELFELYLKSVIDTINFIKERPHTQINIIDDFDMGEEEKTEEWRSELKIKYYNKYLKYKSKYIQLKKQN